MLSLQSRNPFSCSRASSVLPGRAWVSGEVKSQQKKKVILVASPATLHWKVISLWIGRFLLTHKDLGIKRTLPGMSGAVWSVEKKLCSLCYKVIHSGVLCLHANSAVFCLL
jgi:hypothetical protein